MLQASRMMQLTILLCTLFSANVIAQMPLRLGCAFAPPLSTPEQTGVLDRLAQEVFSRVGYDVIITHLPAERALVNANTGIDDGDLLRIDGMEDRYTNLIKVPEKMFAVDFVAFTKNRSIQLHNNDDLNSYSVGLIKGWKILEDAALGVSVLSSVEDADDLFNMLQKNRIDLALYERLEGQTMVRKLQIDNIYELAPPLASEAMYIYLNKRHAALIPKAAEALRQMKQDGTYETIIEQALTQSLR